jgi:hypothetical protein
MSDEPKKRSWAPYALWVVAGIAVGFCIGLKLFWTFKLHPGLFAIAGALVGWAIAYVHYRLSSASSN